MHIVAVVIGLFLIPGPAVLLIISRTVQSGRKAGIMTGLGISTGDFLHALFATAGLSAILMTSAFAFNFVKFAGAAYLLYMGIRAFLEKSPEYRRCQMFDRVSSISAYGTGYLG